ncbi:30S ribosomal protein S14 [Actinacidiphila glaucinigra]|uniref:30S ribosomal protein S14 n=1 Tax=Actinacidiphila glaucinigra TaxID=235986 RepID=UPI0037972A2A
MPRSVRMRGRPARQAVPPGGARRVLGVREQAAVEGGHKSFAVPRDASATRLRNRDALDGRPRGHLRAFGLSRITMRAEAHAGHLPGVRKASW